MTVSTAAWVDAGTGAREEASFRAWSRTGRCFTILHRPSGDPRAVLVVCAPVLIEQMRNYRREVELARLLAARGVATLRFHYRGTGHSDGGNDDLVLGSMVEDAAGAVAHAAEQVGDDVPLGLLGTRLGGLVAAAVRPAAPLVLWHPVLDGRAWVREVQRARAVGDLRAPEAGDEAAAEEDRREVLGYALTTALVDSVSAAQLVPLVRERTGPVFVVDAGRDEDTRTPGARLASAAPHVTRVGVREDASAWWFPAALSDSGDGDRSLQVTADWVAGTVAAP